MDNVLLVSDVIHVRNIHCSSCVKAISTILGSLSPAPSAVETSVSNKTVTVTHAKELSVASIRSALKHGGFEPVSQGDETTHSTAHDNSLSSALYSSKPFPFNLTVNWFRRRQHRKLCQSCQTEHPHLFRKKDSAVVDTVDMSGVAPTDEKEEIAEFSALFSVGGMSCASCSNAITAAVKEIPGVIDCSVDLLGNSARAIVASHSVADDVKSSIQDIGYDCELVEVVPVTKSSSELHTWKVVASIGGMTCAACVNALTETFKTLDFVTETNITLLTNSGTFVVTNPNKVDVIRDTIEDIGYECGEITITEDRSAVLKKQSRTVTIQVDGMFCDQCPKNINEALKKYGKSVEIHSGPISLDNNVIRLTYVPSVPDVTLRAIVKNLTALSPQFRLTLVKPPTLEERARQIALAEQRRLIMKMVLSIVAAIPTFIIGIVMMMVLPKSNHWRQWSMEPIWAGSVSRAVWAMFIISTFVFFFAADIFHRKAIKEIRSLWRPGVSFKRRLLRFGSMNLLMSLGTTIAYFASIALLVIEATSESESGMGMDDGAMSTGYSTTFFDSVVFLTMFLLVGRLLEAITKSKTASAITLLANLRPQTGLIVDSDADTTEEVGIDYIEVGDIVRILSGMSPPADGIVISGEAEFNEAALTGEALPVHKRSGDQIFAGTSHAGGGTITMRVEASEGSTMLDQITNVVRQGQMKRAPIERMADVLTGYFVPIVTALAVITFVVWLALGESGSLPDHYLDIDDGGWPVWSLEFAISVFVVACPCGIGLAAPTAMFVGTGIAAKYGILPRGGGEAFQEGAQVDVVVFDKTGTLTAGGAPSITDAMYIIEEYKPFAIQLARDLELNSTHLLARALLDYAERENSTEISEPSSSEGSQLGDYESDPEEKTSSGVDKISETSPISTVPRRNDESAQASFELSRGHASRYRVRLGPVKVSDIYEAAGRGLKGRVTATDGEQVIPGQTVVEAIIGNEKWMSESGAVLSDAEEQAMLTWKQNGKSVMLLGVRREGETPFTVIALFAAADPLRPEAPFVIKQLELSGIETWMISGDNEITAKAVARQVGISEDHVIGGVLPQEKAEKVNWLQKTATANAQTRTVSLFSGRNRKERAIVAMVGDGINDAPPLAAADIGIAIGSGSEIALSSAKFVLMSSDLTQILTLFDISKVVFKRVVFNFAWAGIYNLIGLPIAAGVIYPANHARLAPAWASLAMAMSSVSVVCSSLALKLYQPKKYDSNMFRR
ncbi:E1-E2 ATPase-domain-containing protein [Lipomyces oligophaga]|uniref:E1-E2 ATPase-domain-containing protein n=1 Tax=Lipomyces oligophaga TaxID=45792 RepID=UPI0034CFB3AA